MKERVLFVGGPVDGHWREDVEPEYATFTINLENAAGHAFAKAEYRRLVIKGKEKRFSIFVHALEDDELIGRLIGGYKPLEGVLDAQIAVEQQNSNPPRPVGFAVRRNHRTIGTLTVKQVFTATDEFNRLRQAYERAARVKEET